MQDPWAPPPRAGTAVAEPPPDFSIPDIGKQAEFAPPRGDFDAMAAPFSPLMQGGPVQGPPGSQSVGDMALSGLEDVVRGAEIQGGRMAQTVGKLGAKTYGAVRDAFGTDKTQAEKAREIRRAQKPGLALQAQGETHPAPTSLPGKIAEGLGSAVPILATGGPGLAVAGLGGVDDAYTRTLQETGSEVKATERALAEIPLQALYLAPLGRIISGAGEGATLARRALDGATSGLLGPGSARVLGEVASESISKEDKADLASAVQRGLAEAGGEALVNVPVFAFLSAAAGVKLPEPKVSQPELTNKPAPEAKVSEGVVPATPDVQKPDVHYENNHIDTIGRGENKMELVAKDIAGKPVGVVEYTQVGDQVHVDMVTVRADMRRQGVGKRLLDEVRKANPQATVNLGMSVSEAGDALKASAQRDSSNTDQTTSAPSVQLEQPAKAPLAVAPEVAGETPAHGPEDLPDLPPEAKRVVYHGSPYVFDKFDVQKIGTGEGAQVFGHGLYFAGEPEVAKTYAPADTEWKVTGDPYAIGNAKAGATLQEQHGDVDKAVASLEKQLKIANRRADNATDWGPIEAEEHSVNVLKIRDAIQSLKSGAVVPTKGTGGVYEVALHPNEDELLDWDKPLSEQSDTVKKAIEKQRFALVDPSDSRLQSGTKNARMQRVADKSMTGAEFYNYLMPEQRDRAAGADASALLESSGIKGIRYLDQQSRGAGEGSRNYVIFNDADVEILKPEAAQPEPAPSPLAGEGEAQPAEGFPFEETPTAAPVERKPLPPAGSFDEAIKLPEYREILNQMAEEAGQNDVGGQITTDPVTGERTRSHWAPKAEWWDARPGGMTKGEVQRLVARVMATPEGKSPMLSSRQRTMLEYMFHNAPNLSAHLVGATPDEPGSRGALDLFGPSKPRPAAPEGAFDVPDETRRDRLYSGLVNDLERIVQLEKAAPNKIAGESLEQSLSLMPGRRFGNAETFKARALDPFKKALAQRKIPAIESKGDAPSASDYMYAVHVLEAPDSPEMGMKPVEAQKIRAQAESSLNAPAYAKIREFNQKLNVARLDVLEQGGLISAETRKAWEEKYGPDYVPLRTAQDPFEKYVGQGKGLGVRGKESKKREGRSSRADSPLVFALETMDTAMERAASNHIGQKLGELVEKNPEGPWKIETDQNKRRQGEEWLPYKVNGEQRFIVTEDKGLAEAFKRLQNPDPGVIRVLDPLLKFWHKVIIQYNPVFPLTNVPRDIGVAAIRHAIHGDLPAALGTISQALPAAKGAFEAIRTEGAGGKWGDVYRQARDAGALIGWKDVHDYGSRVKDFEKAVSRSSKAAAFGELINDLNSSTELGTRLATFKALLDSGKSLPESAVATRRITADFARRGRWAPVYRRLWLFSGANVQGTSEMLSSIGKNPKRAATVLGALMGAGYLNYALSKQFGDENELDKLSESDKARFIGVMLGKRRYGFAAPYGFNLFPYLGWKLAEATLGGKDPKKMLGGLASTAIDSFSPLPQGASVTQSLTPTVARPFEEIAENRKFSGAPIEPDQSPFDKVKKPHAQRYFPNVSGASREIADGLARLTGGNELEPGFVDISPEWIDHLAAAATGGLGTFAGRGAKTLEAMKDVIVGNPTDLRLSDIPIFRPFVQEASRGAGTRVYHENVSDIELAKKQRKEGLPVKEPGLLSLDPLERETAKRITALYKALDKAPEKDKLPIQKAIDDLRDQFNAAAKAARKPGTR